MADSKISQLPSGQLLPQTIFPIVTNGTTSQTTFDGLVNAINPLISGGTGGTVGPQGPTGPQGPIGLTGAAGAVGPAGLTWQGLWDMDTQYVEDDAVGYGGASWFCISGITTTGNQDPSIDSSHWALLASQGAVGPAGPQGPIGSQGPIGNDGATGPQGPQGIQGIQGLNGNDGAQGVTGPQGPQGNDGAVGAQGIQGVAGAVGPAGLNWQGLWNMDIQYVEDDAVGFSGASWFCISGITTTGNDNPTVDTGHWALLASQGAVGPQGPLGATGPQGASGATGPQGIQGPAGSAATMTQSAVFVSNTQPYNVLDYDINGTYGSGVIRLPENAPVGKLIIVRNNYTAIGVQAFDGQPKISNYQTNGATSSVTIGSYETKHFISLGNGYWYSIAIQGETSNFNGTPLNVSNLFSINETFTSSTTLPPSTSQLNTSYSMAPVGAKVYCANITNGGRVYIKTTYNTWTSIPLVGTWYTGATSGLDTYITGGTYSSGTAVFTNNMGNTFSVSGFSTGGSGDVYWVSGGTGTGSLKRNLFANIANSDYAAAFGYATEATADMSAAFNYATKASGYASNAFGYSTSATTQGAFSQGQYTLASGMNSFAEGQETIAEGYAAHAEGYLVRAYGDYSHAEGYQTSATTLYSHAEGYQTKASGQSAHAEGSNNTAQGLGSHAEGANNIASGTVAHAEGFQTQATGYASHAEGYNSIAQGDQSHAQNYSTQANGINSHAGGYNSIANGVNSFVHSVGSTVSGARSAVLGGSGFTATAADTVYVPNLVIKKVDAVPTSSGDSIGEAGSVTWDANYFYWKTQSDGWLRVTGSTF